MKFYQNPAIHFCTVCGCFPAPTAVWAAAAEAVQPAKLKSLSTQPFGERGRASVSCGCLPRSSQAAFSGVRDSRTPPPSSQSSCLDQGNTCDVKSAAAQGELAWALCPKGMMWSQWTTHSLTPFSNLKEAAESRRQKQKSTSTETLRSREPGWESRWGTGDQAPLRSRPGLGAFPGWEAGPALLQPWPRAAGAHLSQEQEAAAQQACPTIPEGKNCKSHSDDPLPEKRKTSEGPRIVTDNRSHVLKYWAMRRKEAGPSPVPTGNNNKYFRII